MERKEIGAFGEKVAGEWLKKNGYAIIERNFRCRAGEIDIIACRGGTLVFTEVKTRTGDAFGTPAEAVDRRKQLHMRRAASWYLQMHRIRSTPVRFDVVEVLIDHLKGVTECSYADAARWISETFRLGLEDELEQRRQKPTIWQRSGRARIRKAVDGRRRHEAEHHEQAAEGDRQSADG